jgi:ParB family transcriptional regulator, chromosome partitioning protein
MSEVSSVPLGMIVILPGRRQIDEAMVAEIADSFLEVGQIDPIVLRPKDPPDSAGAFILVSGNHRIRAAQQIGWEEINAIIREMDGDDVEMIELAENLHRGQLGPADFDRALVRWKVLYERRHPESKSPARGGILPQAAPFDSDKPKAPSFTKAASETTGISRREVQRSVKRGSSLTDEEREVLERKGVKVKEVDQIASIEDPAVRTHAVKLIAAGQKPDEAIERAARGSEFTPEADGPKADAEEMSFEEWLESLPLRSKVNRLLFDRDAKIYFDLRKARLAFVAAAKKVLKPKQHQSTGRLHALYSRIVDLKHPRYWLLCGYCDGVGMDRGQPTVCSHCRGGGYQLG